MGQYVLCVKGACVCVCERCMCVCVKGACSYVCVGGGGGEGEDWGETAETTQYYMYSNQW